MVCVEMQYAVLHFDTKVQSYQLACYVIHAVEFQNADWSEVLQHDDKNHLLVLKYSTRE